MFHRHFKKRTALAALLLLLLGAVAAIAYFTGGSNSVTGSGTVGASTQWSITEGSPTWSGGLSAIYPGAGTEYLPFTVTNNGSGHQAVTSITASLPAKANGDAETAAGVDIPGCLASWFTVSVDASNPSLPANLAPAGTYNGKVDLTMQDSGTNQNACQNAAPAVTITAS